MRPRGPTDRAWRTLLLGLLALLAGVGCGKDGGPPAVDTRPLYDARGQALRDVEVPATRPNLILVVIDALRHDALPLEEGRALDERMPHLAALARRGVAFSNAVAPAPWTLPSMTSMLTGLQPSAHGLTAPTSRVQLVDAITTWAEVLQATYGYETAAYTAGPWFQGNGKSVLQGFERKRAEYSLRDSGGDLDKWARGRDPERPFFLLLHTYDVHDPYGEANHPWHGKTQPDVANDPTLIGPAADPAEIFRRTYQDTGVAIAMVEALGRPALTSLLHRYAQSGYKAAPRPDLASELEDAYWGGVRWADGMLAATLNQLDERGLLDGTLLVVSGDHGEAFGEHGTLAHGGVLYDELLRIPLVLCGPPPFAGGRRVTSSIGFVDLLPTFFEWAGLQPLTDVEGRSRLALLEEDRSCRPVLSEERLGFINTGEPVDAIRLSVRTEAWKYVVTFDLQRGTTHEEAYDLLLDAAEQDDLGGGTGRIPAEQVFDDCFCQAVEEVRERLWDRSTPSEESASHIPYGASNRSPSTPPPIPCRGPDIPPGVR